MTISALPTPPLRADPVSFSARADAFLAALPTFAAEANALAVAMNLNSTNDISATSMLVGTGVKTLIVSSGKSFQPGMCMVIADTAAPSANWMYGRVTSYSGVTLVVNVTDIGGSGTKAAWVMSQSAPKTDLGFPTGTRMPFAQAAAPTGWTQDTTDNADNRMLRVVNTVGGGVAGTHSPILNNVVPSHTHGFTTGAESADHGHNYTDPTHVHYMNMNSEGSSIDTIDYRSSVYNSYAQAYTAASATNITINGRTAAHTHSGSTDNGSSQTSWAPRYIDLIICSKN